MDQPDENRPNEPGLSTDPAETPPAPPVTVTTGGTDAGPASGPNPYTGTYHAPAPIIPPAVIHAAGDARPGEANPAGADVAAEKEPAISTAQPLADREPAEDAS